MNIAITIKNGMNRQGDVPIMPMGNIVNVSGFKNMTPEDRERLEQLMKHYAQPYTQSHELLELERMKYPDGQLPERKNGEREEFEGPFFCRVIAELLAHVKA